MEESTKIKRTGTHSFSLESKIELNLPVSWETMKDGMWLYVCRLLAVGIAPQAVANAVVLRMLGKAAKYVPEMQLAVAATNMDFIANPPELPCRPSEIGKVKAVDADFHGVNFAQYLAAENYYQASLGNREDFTAVDGLLEILYPGYTLNYPDPEKDENRFAARYIAIMWYTALKKMFAEIFGHLFKPAGGASEAPDMRKVMTTQIHVLSGGDITKEKAILEAETWSALTELDIKIEESEQIKRMK